MYSYALRLMFTLMSAVLSKYNAKASSIKLLQICSAIRQYNLTSESKEQLLTILNRINTESGMVPNTFSYKINAGFRRKYLMR